MIQMYFAWNINAGDLEGVDPSLFKVCIENCGYVSEHILGAICYFDCLPLSSSSLSICLAVCEGCSRGRNSEVCGQSTIPP